MSGKDWFLVGCLLLTWAATLGTAYMIGYGRGMTWHYGLTRYTGNGKG